MRRTEWSITIALCAVGLAAGCGAETPNQGGSEPVLPASGTPGLAGNGAVPPTTASTTATPTNPASNTPPTSVGTAGAPSAPPITGPATPPAGPTTPAGTDGVPCAVAKVISDHCTLCHAAMPQGGAPMPLMTLADFQAPAKSNAAMTVAQIIPTRINATDQARLMPPVNSTKPLVDAEKMTLTTWLGAGAKGASGADACPITAPAMGDGTMMPATTGGSGGASLAPIEYNDPDMKCYEFLTHAPGDVTMPYTHGPGEEYVNFTFKAPWTGTVYTRAHELSVGNAPILHHWLLYVDPTPGQDGGVQGGSTGIHPSSNLLHAWAPGASPLYFDPDTGMKLGASVGLTLEAHINNQTGASGQDHNGAKICVTPKVPTHIVDLTWTGTEQLGSLMASGTCTPPGKEPMHIVAAQPHMHKKGTHMKVVVNRAGGMKETIHDADFSFDNQQYYIQGQILMPGDTFTVTCSYSAPASFGQSTNNEMCYWFPFVWPAGSLASGAGIHGPTTCLR